MLTTFSFEKPGNFMFRSFSENREMMFLTAVAEPFAPGREVEMVKPSGRLSLEAPEAPSPLA
jgi:hypothetical protein